MLSDRILVMRDGIIEQEGTPAEIHSARRSPASSPSRRCRQHPALRRGRTAGRSDCDAGRRCEIAGEDQWHARERLGLFPSDQLYAYH